MSAGSGLELVGFSLTQQQPNSPWTDLAPGGHVQWEGVKSH